MHVLVYFYLVWICIICLSRSSVEISSGYYMQSKSDFWLVPSWRRVLCRVLILQMVEAWMYGEKNSSLLWSLCQLRLSWWGSGVEAVHPSPFSLWVNFVSIFTSVKLKKKVIINWTGYRSSNFDFTLHHLANKSAAIVPPFPELGVVAEIKHLTERT